MTQEQINISIKRRLIELIDLIRTSDTVGLGLQDVVTFNSDGSVLIGTGANPVVTSCPESVPGDSTIIDESCSFYLTTSPDKLNVKVKLADSTVLTGEVADLT
jgi:hypothetical protein